MSAKQRVLEAISRLPDDAEVSAIYEEVALLAALEEAESDVREGRIMAHAEVRENFRQWTTTTA